MGEKSIRLVTALVECRPFAEVGWHELRSWVMGDERVCESWRVKMGDGTLRDICHRDNSWYVVHDAENDRQDDRWSP